MKPRSSRTKGIVLSRTNFGEADRIITFLTPDSGKVRVMAKAVRKSTSKLAGGIELFSVSDISFISGKGDIKTLISTRLIKHYGQIVKDIERTTAGYEMIMLIDKNTEEHAEADFFELLCRAFEALDSRDTDLNLIRLWFFAQLLRLTGHVPNLKVDTQGLKLAADRSYDFNFEEMCFQSGRAGHNNFDSNHIKLLRLVFADSLPASLQRITEASVLSAQLLPLGRTMLQFHLRA